MVIDKVDNDFSYTKSIMEKYPRDQRYTLAILQDIQKECNYIPKEAMILLSGYLEVPLSRLYSMATFYRALSLKPKGENIIKVCDGTACHIRSSMTILDEIQKILPSRIDLERMVVQRNFL